MMSTLFAEIVGWAVRNGAERIDQLGRPWEGETDEWRVRINATGQEVDSIPHMAAALDDFIVHIIQTPGDHAIRVGHLRAARAALEASYYEAHPLPWQIEAEPDDPDRPYRIKDANGNTVVDTRWGACTKSGRDLYTAIVRAANARLL